MKFDNKLHAALESLDKNELVIEEGMTLNINAVVSDAIKIPVGSYTIWADNGDTCMLIPSHNEDRQTYEVFKKSLEAYNPEVFQAPPTPLETDTISEKD